MNNPSGLTPGDFYFWTLDIFTLYSGPMSNQNLQNQYPEIAQMMQQLNETIALEKAKAMQNMANRAICGGVGGSNQMNSTSWGYGITHAPDAYQQAYQNMQFGGLDPKQFLKPPQFPANPPPFAPSLNTVMNDEHAQDIALMSMNPIARHKYEALFRILEIKVRFANLVRGVDCSWILVKEVPDASPVRQEWTAPSKDPGCSLKTWDAMVAELLDEVARRGGVDVTTDFDHRTESAGDETVCSTGNT